MKTIQIQVPDDAAEGDILTLTVDGNDIELPVPEGSQPGDILQIQVGTTNSNNDDDSSNNEIMDGEKPVKSENDEPNNVDLIELDSSTGGITLELYDSVPSHFKSTTALNQTLDDDDSACIVDGTYSMAWPAGRHMAKYVSSSMFNDLRKNARVAIELGSGLGIGGLALAAAAAANSVTDYHQGTDVQEGTKKEIHRQLHVTLTDLPPGLPLLEYNIQMNKDKVIKQQQGDINVTVAPLTWGASSPLPLSIKDKTVDIILRSDLLYNTSPHTYDALSQTIHRIVQTSQISRVSNSTQQNQYSELAETKIILSVRWRKPVEERAFFEKMHDLGYEFELVDTTSLLLGDSDTGPMNNGNNNSCCCLDWKTYGNPSCEMSNLYFTNTLVEVKGVCKPLKDVTEQDMEEMNDGEYHEFEAKFIQIYVGTLKNDG